MNCQGKAHINKDIEDVTNMSLDFENGGFATIHSSWLDPNKIREMVIVGSKRMIVYDDNQQQQLEQNVVVAPFGRWLPCPWR